MFAPALWGQQAFTYKGHNIYKYRVDYDMMAANMNSLA